MNERTLQKRYRNQRNSAINQEDYLSIKKVGHKSETMINFYKRLKGQQTKSTSLSPYRQHQNMENTLSQTNQQQLISRNPL